MTLKSNEQLNTETPELRVISDEAMAKVEFLLTQPGEPSEALTKLMTGKRKYLIREDLGNDDQSPI